jgi:prepilin-type N-terminal cleavage/methylation domain-containing protein
MVAMTSSRSKVHRSKVHSGGFTMVELLITMLLLAIVMTGLAGLQVHTIRQTTAARWAGEATRLAQDAMEKHLAGPIPSAAGWGYESNRFGFMSGVAADGSPPGPYTVESLVEVSGTNTLITVRVTYRDVDARAAATPRRVYLTTMRTP